MFKYIYTDLALSKRAYRVTTVVAESPDDARGLLVLGDGWLPQIGEGRPTKARRGRSSRLLRTVEEAERFFNSIGFTKSQVDTLIREALPRMLRRFEYTLQITSSRSNRVSGSGSVPGGGFSLSSTSR
jgi:hypothetical protein